MSGTENKKLSEIFSEVAPKIISFKEYKEKRKQVMKQKLNLIDKIEVILSKPFNLYYGIKTAFALIFNEKKRQSIKDEIGDGSVGMYKDPLTNDKFISTKLVSIYSRDVENKFFCKGKISQKVAQLEVDAMNQCEDFSYLKSASRLKPTL